MNRHFTVSVYVVHKGKVLLHRHKKANLLLPVGGHIDANELPEEAAIRETLEEAGLLVELYDEDSLKAKQVDTEKEKVLINPIHTIWGEVAKGHEHIDFVFYGKSRLADLKPGINESNQLEWYGEEQLESMKESLLKDVYFMAKEAIQLYEERGNN